MIQFVYDESESSKKRREVYILYYNGINYCSMFMAIPVKLEIDRRNKEIMINNLCVGSENEKQFACEIFQWIKEMRDMFEIKDYKILEVTSSGRYYIEVYKTNTIQ
jgi:hypothetical protein